MKIHITSDVHLDFWIDAKHPQAKQIRLISELIKILSKKKIDSFPTYGLITIITAVIGLLLLVIIWLLI